MNIYNYASLLAMLLLFGTISYSQTPTQLADLDGGLNRITYPDGAAFTENAFFTTGAIRIQLPVGYTNKMIKMRVEVNNTTNDQSYTAWISGYASVAGSNTSWKTCSAQILTSLESLELPVYFGDNGDANDEKLCIWIGEVTTPCNRLKVNVAEVMFQGNSGDLTDFQTGWSITRETNDFSSLVNNFVTNTLPVAQQQSVEVELEEQHQLTQTSNGINRITYPEGASFFENATFTSGAIKIQLPVGYTNTMMRMRVEIMNTINYQSFTALITGYTFASNNGNTKNWKTCSAQLLTSTESLELPVYFGDDGDPIDPKVAIWIGGPNAQWSRLAVQVSEVTFLGDEDDLIPFKSGWSIARDTDPITSYNYSNFIINTLPAVNNFWSADEPSNIIYTDNQQVAIGLNDPGAFHLAVDGDVKARRIQVTAENWPDYVFAEGYDLTDLESLRQYLIKHQHLPGVPSKKEAEENGVFLNDMNTILLEKVEELTLYILDQEERIKRLELQLTETNQEAAANNEKQEKSSTNEQ